VAWILKRKVITLEEALGREADEHEHAHDEERGAEAVGMEEVRFVDLGNGQSLVLE
jgi:hypothetical protein